MVSTIEDLDEMRAHAAYQYEYGPGADVSPFLIVKFMEYARAIREADERAGLVTVPKEANPAMEKAWGDCDHEETAKADWAVMTAASPFAKKDDAK